MNNTQKNIEWNYPQPANSWEKFIGPGATKGEQTLMLLPTVLLTAGLLIMIPVQGIQWNVWQYLVAGLMAFDLVGGVITNATSTAKRWYHRPGQGTAKHLQFVAVHIFQLFLITWAFNDLNWIYLISVYGYLMLSSWIILQVPLHLQRPLAFGIYTLTLMLHYSFLTSVEGFASIPGLEWFIPVFFFKLLISHLLTEEPYRPEKEVRSGK